MSEKVERELRALFAEAEAPRRVRDAIREASAGGLPEANG